MLYSSCCVTVHFFFLLSFSLSPEKKKTGGGGQQERKRRHEDANNRHFECVCVCVCRCRVRLTFFYGVLTWRNVLEQDSLCGNVTTGPKVGLIPQVLVCRKLTKRRPFSFSAARAAKVVVVVYEETVGPRCIQR